MAICSNCFSDHVGEVRFCPVCGFPIKKVGFKHCPGNRHIIFDTYNRCPLCMPPEQAATENIAEPRIDSQTTLNDAIEKEPNTDDNIPVPQNTSLYKLMNEVADEEQDFGRTTAQLGAVPMKEFSISPNPFPDKTTIEDFFENKKGDTTNSLSPLNLSNSDKVPCRAWVVTLDRNGIPIRDTRIAKEKIMIGKGAEADILLTDEFVSRLHALIYYIKERFYISDLGSTNGTFLNDKQVMKEELKDGDHIRIGRQTMVFKRPSPNTVSDGGTDAH